MGNLSESAFVATPKQLVAAVSEQTGVAGGTVILHDRNLMNAGLRSAGQRGRGKSVVTFEDAANLLIAVAGSRTVKDSAAVVRDFSGLLADAPLISGDGGEGTRGTSFGDALAALLEALPANRQAYDNPENSYVEVRLYGPRPSAAIEWKYRDRIIKVEYRSRSEGAAHPFNDLEFISKFTQVTIGHVGELVSS
ncbi:hypothetical protein [Hansschlegelia sp. KR7-227]|uniref:hypothetical protein n=1 Tax=Hansschlegelia sp. KR7-227 TaxID=3400914 RepID=UPI003C056C6E